MHGAGFLPQSKLGRWFHSFEETAIAILLGLMTIIQFANVIVRYIFGSGWFASVREALGLPNNLLWALESTVFLFAWLVLFGVSHCVKTGAHLGVDVLINIVPAALRKLLGLIAVLCCILYTALLLKGAWDYWAPFANLPPTTGRIVPNGFETDALGQGWYEVNDIEMPSWLGFLSNWLNDGESYEKLPRVIPYFILPVGMLLLLIRFLQAAIRLLKGDIDRVIASHEAEDMVEEASSNAAREG